jgi:hypothetical protein
VPAGSSREAIAEFLSGAGSIGPTRTGMSRWGQLP